MGPTLRGFRWERWELPGPALRKNGRFCCRLNLAVFVKLSVQSLNLMTGGRSIWQNRRSVVFLFQGLWPRNLMNFYASICFLFTETVRLGSSILLIARIYLYAPSILVVFCLYMDTQCSRMREGIYMDPQYLVNLFLMQVSQYLLYCMYALHCFTMFTSFYFQPSGANWRFGFLDAPFFGTHATLAAKRVTHTMERHVLEKIVEMTEIIRNHNIAKIKVDKFADLMSLTSFFDICASHKSSMQGVFHSYRILWFCRTLTIQSNTSRIFDISAVFVTFHSSYHILRSLVYHGSSRSMAEWDLNLKASIEPEAVPGQWMLMRWI